jgi:acetolactate synthase-1/2/3 large subunit
VTGGRVLAAALHAEGVDTVFGMIGSHVTAVYDALLDFPAIRTIDVRHEQAAGYMADGYARVTGRPGVCLVTAGPGATNTLTAVASAFADSSPVLVLAGQVPSDVLGRNKGVFHECPDQLGLFRSVTGWRGRADDLAAIPRLVGEAFLALRSGRPRPAYLEIPCDVLDARGPDVPPAPALAGPARREAPADDGRRAAARLAASRAPGIWAGGGVIRSGASAALRDLAEALGAPVFVTMSGKGALPADHPLAVDYWLPAEPARALLESADLVLAVGTRFTSMATAGWRLRMPGMVQVDVDPGELGKNYPIEAGLCGDAGAVLRQLRAAVGGGPRAWRADAVARVRREVEEAAARSFAESHRLLGAIRSRLRRDAIVVCDITTLGTLARRYFPVYEPRTFVCPLGFGTLGSAYPLALGAKRGRPERQVVAICGDGGFLFNLQELATAAQHGLGVVALVVNDGGYGAIRDWQRRHAGGRFTSVDLVAPDFMGLAQAFGVVGLRAKGADDVGDVLEAALRETRPVLLEVPVTLEHPGFG